jgi:predicted kinase
VIVDATFHRHDERDAFRAGFGHPDARLLFVECRASAQLLAARVDIRTSKPKRVSDADQAIVERQLDESEPLHEVPPRQHIQLTTDAPVQEVLEEVEAFIDGTMEDAGAWR